MIEDARSDARASVEGEPVSRERWRVGAGAVRRWLWAGVVLTALVALLAAARYVRDARQPAYLATQTLIVSALAPSGGGAAAGAAADHAAAQVAVAYGGSPALGSARTLAAVAAQVRADGELAAGRFGASAARAAGVEARAPGALVVTHDGGRIAVTGHASSAAGAWLLATAAGQTLAREAAQSPEAAEAAGQGVTVRVLLAGTASAPVADPAPVASARARLVETLLLGLAGGALVVLGASAWDPRARRAAGTAGAETLELEARGAAAPTQAAQPGGEA